jgi:hypothetical protein
VYVVVTCTKKITLEILSYFLINNDVNNNKYFRLVFNSCIYINTIFNESKVFL